MKFIAVKDLKSPKEIRKKLMEEKELLLTSNGKPMAVLINVDESDDPEQTLQSVREARSRLALQKIRNGAADRGIDKLGIDEINTLISNARSHRKA